MANTDYSPEETWIPTYCFQCNAGPDLLRVKTRDGVAVKIDGNPAFADCHPGDAKVCLKAYGLIQKLYNPNRVKSPLKRTNPKKGRDEDPGWVEIGWEEALDLVAEKLLEVRSRGVLNEAGCPRLAMTMGADGTPPAYYGTMDAFFTAWGPFDRAFGAGGGIRCMHSEHIYGELWHCAFTCAADVPRCNYILAFGCNANASSGVVGIRRHSEARARGMRRVQIEPQLSVTGATADEWIPIRPKTDAAFLLSMLYVILWELRTWDSEFLQKMTNSPYLVGPDGNFVRHPGTGKPLVWDAARGEARPFDAGDIEAYALEGKFKANGIEARPAFALLTEHVQDFTPEWAAEITGVKAETIRRIAREFTDNALIGATIDVEGTRLPYRPVNIYLGKGVSNGPGSFQAVWAEHVLQIIVGALEVPGGHLGTFVQIGGPLAKSADGFNEFPLHPVDAGNWAWPPQTRDAWSSLTPLNGTSHRNQTMGAHHLAWLNLSGAPEGWPNSDPPEIWFTFKTNPAVSQSDTDRILAGMARIPFHVAFAYVLDETSSFADVVLPECGDLESLQLFRVGGVRYLENFWEKAGVAIRQPVVAPVNNTRDISDIFTELAARTGLLEPYNEAINAGIVVGIPLKTPAFDYHLEPGIKYSVEQIYDRLCKAVTRAMSRGQQEHDLAWYKEHGAFLVPYPKLEGIVMGPVFLRPWYLHALMKKMGLRYELPYQERLKQVGEQLGKRLHAVGAHFWDDQLQEYQALPEWHDIPSLWDTGKAYDLWLITCRSMQFAWGGNTDIPNLIEAAKMVMGHDGISINAAAARARGIQNGDQVWVESAVGRMRAKAIVREGIHPEVVLATHMFGHWQTPVAKDLNWPSMNPITPLSYQLTDETGGTSDHVRVKVYRV
ncbi:MAG: molybdopterin-dependent oxidoreductase [Desulfobacterales bacterium]|nr:molybdopterin-dependent oxidoreductase [Desulfobacterales bacterium]